MTSFFTNFELDKEDFNGKFIGIIEEHHADSSFLINTFLWKLCQEKENGTLFFTLHNTIEHYALVTTKMGINFNKVIDNFNLIVLKYNDLTNKVSELSELLEVNIQKLKVSNSKITILIDDLSDLLNYGYNYREVVSIYRYLVYFLKKYDLTVIINMHWNKEDTEQNCLTTLITQEADYCFFVSSLETGISKEVTGKITYYKKSLVNISGLVKTVMNYKLSDRVIKLFTPGTLLFNIK